MPWSLAEYLDAFWALMLSEGKGGFINFAEYKESLVETFWEGKTRDGDQIASAQAAIGQAAPEDAMAELRRLHEEAVARSKASTE